MTGEHFNKLIKAAPFRPFALILADGRPIQIEHPEITRPSRTGRIIEIEQTDESFIYVDLLLVLPIEVSPPRNPVSELPLDEEPPAG